MPLPSGAVSVECTGGAQVFRLLLLWGLLALVALRILKLDPLRRSVTPLFPDPNKKRLHAKGLHNSQAPCCT
ncbi:MAG: hypothetical protein WB542_14520, partial [Polaromonas sp.]